MRLFRVLYDNSVSCVRTGGTHSSWFKIEAGVRQGCVLAPNSFATGMDWLLDRTVESCSIGIKWYQFVRNDDVQRLTKQPKLTAIIQSRRLILFGHIMRMDDNTDAKRILLASPLADWRRQLGRPCITWLSIVQLDVRQHHLTLPEAADLAQNCPL